MQRRKHKVASVERARDEGNIIVVAHLRRGDILKSNLWQERKRLVTFPFYKSLLNMLLQVRNDFFETVQKSYLELPISIFLLSEDSPSNGNQIIEHDLGIINGTYFLNATDELISTCNNHTRCSIQVLPGSTSALSSFTSMCDSDILISGTSSFSLLAVALCQPSLSLAVQFGTDFKGLQNIIEIGPSFKAYPMWHQNTTASVNLTELRRLFKRIVDKRQNKNNDSTKQY
mmetsp:Transcript_29654/g.28379  ORF Transcript_29654/g.28379 Transcript_29654/m.28379 type:complete len:230 (-) Transcript_29654:298-987(-)